MVGRASLSLEDYVDFFQNPQQHYLSKNHLNQVMSMHGFQKLNVPRTDLVEESTKLTMESPFRSTLEENITSGSLLNPDEIKKDVATLRWNEWKIDSVRICRSGGQQSSLTPGEEERQYSLKFVESQKKSSKTKKGLADISDLPSAANQNSSKSKQNQAQKKKRKEREVQGGREICLHVSMA